MEKLSIVKGLLVSASIIGTINLVGFTITGLTYTHKLTDLCGTGAFVVVALYNYFKNQSVNNVMGARKLLLVTAITAWGVRLTSYLFYRVMLVGEDKRLDAFLPKEGEAWLDKENSNFPVKLTSFWIIQSLWAFIVLLPSNIALYSPKQSPLRLTGTLSFLLFLTGFFIESLADYQKFQFRQDPQNAGKWIDHGLYQYSRYPNYFGEMLVWSSLYLLSLPLFSRKLHYASIVSPLFVMLLLLYVSGVPILEKQNEAKWGGDQEYQLYKSRTSMLIPWFPASPKGEL